MAERQYRATLSKGRSGWCLIFRHPLAKTTDGREQLRVRRGLGTRDEEEAKRLVDQMNEILSDPAYWNLAAKEKAEAKFEPEIVAGFYSYLTPDGNNGWNERGRFLPLPTKEDGYATVQLVGTTGAGKTTVVRQIIGTNPKTERFPSISASKTTICDIEVIFSDGPLQARLFHLSPGVKFDSTSRNAQLLRLLLFSNPACPVRLSAVSWSIASSDSALAMFSVSLSRPKVKETEDLVDDDNDDDEEEELEDTELTNEEREAFSEQSAPVPQPYRSPGDEI